MQAVMARGSEPFAWKLRPHLPHVCRLCSRELKRDDVAEDSKLGYVCKWCRDARLERLIAEARGRLGLGVATEPEDPTLPVEKAA